MKQQRKSSAGGEPPDDAVALLAAIVESSDDAIITTTLDGRITTWNTAAERMLGYSAREAIGSAVTILIPAGHADEEPAIVDRILRGERIAHYETQRRCKDGRVIQVSLSVSPIRNRDGVIVGISNIARDIADRKRTDEMHTRLEDQSEGRFRMAVESAPNAVVMVDRSGKIVLVNAQTEKLFGYARDELLDRSIEMLVPQRFRDAHPAHRLGFFADPQARSMGAGRDLYGLTKSGKEVPVEIGLNPIKTDEGSFVLAAIVDNTARKRAEERLRIVVESAPSAMLMVDDRGTIVLVNAQTEKLFGYSRHELLEQPIELLVPERFRGRHPGFRTAFFADPLSRPMGAGRDLYGLRKDGIEVPVEIGLNPIKTEEGSFVLAAVVDITQRKRAQSVLAQKNEEVEAFVYIVSHDLRTPLVNLQGFSKELEVSCRELKEKLEGATLPASVDEGVRAILDQDVAGALRYISASTNKFERLINALLQLSRSGRRDYHWVSLDLQALVGSTLDSVQQTIETTKAAIRVGSLPAAWGDATAVGQVFSNLVANALNYLKAGRPGLIEIGGETQGAMNHYWVRDNGVGIPPAARERLFQVFQRFHPDLAPGEGMGLAIIKRIVERHGGKVWVESEQDEGTTFHLTLPARERKEEAEASGASWFPTPRGSSA